MMKNVPKKIIQPDIPKDFFPWVDEASWFADNLDARSIRIVQNSDGWIETMALPPSVRKRLGICRARARDSLTQWCFPVNGESRAGETLLSGHGEPDLIFHEIVGNMIP
jgi:hypothetical protein